MGLIQELLSQQNLANNLICVDANGNKCLRVVEVDGSAGAAVPREKLNRILMEKGLTAFQNMLTLTASDKLALVLQKGVATADVPRAEMLAFSTLQPNEKLAQLAGHDGGFLGLRIAVEV